MRNLHLFNMRYSQYLALVCAELRSVIASCVNATNSRRTPSTCLLRNLYSIVGLLQPKLPSYLYFLCLFTPFCCSYAFAAVITSYLGSSLATLWILIGLA